MILLPEASDLMAMAAQHLQADTELQRTSPVLTGGLALAESVKSGEIRKTVIKKTIK
jgi:hypothetical protein